MAISFVQALQSSGAATTGSSSTVSVTTNAACSAGDIIIGVAASRVTNSVTLSSVSGGGLTWTVDATIAGALNGYGIFSAQAPSGLASSTTITATFSANATRHTLAVFEFSGVATSGAAYAATSGSGNSSGTFTVVTLSGLTIGDLVIGGLEQNLSSTTPVISAGSGFTIPANGGDTVAGNSAEVEGVLEYLIAGSTSQAITFTTTNGAAYSGGGVAYKAASSVTTPLIQPMIISNQSVQTAGIW